MPVDKRGYFISKLDDRTGCSTIPVGLLVVSRILTDLSVCSFSRYEFIGDILITVILYEVSRSGFVQVF